MNIIRVARGLVEENMGKIILLFAITLCSWLGWMLGDSFR